MFRDPTDVFRCPLRSSCHGAHGERLASYRAEILLQHQSCTRAAQGRQLANERHLRRLRALAEVG